MNQKIRQTNPKNPNSTSRRSSVNYEFISGVFSSCVLQMISKLRKNFEFTMESIEEVEKCYFKINGHNFINVAPEYEFIINDFCKTYLEKQIQLNHKVLNTYLIRPLTELTKNSEAFMKTMEAGIDSLRERYQMSKDSQNTSNLLKTEDFGVSAAPSTVKLGSPRGPHQTIPMSHRKGHQLSQHTCSRNTTAAPNIIGFDSSLLHKPEKAQWNILGTQNISLAVSAGTANGGGAAGHETGRGRDLKEQIKHEQEELKKMEMKRKNLDLRLREEIVKQRNIILAGGSPPAAAGTSPRVCKTMTSMRGGDGQKSGPCMDECSTDELRDYKLDISSEQRGLRRLQHPSSPSKGISPSKTRRMVSHDLDSATFRRTPMNSSHHNNSQSRSPSHGRTQRRRQRSYDVTSVPQEPTCQSPKKPRYTITPKNNLSNKKERSVSGDGNTSQLLESQQPPEIQASSILNKSRQMESNTTPKKRESDENQNLIGSLIKVKKLVKAKHPHLGTKKKRRYINSGRNIDPLGSSALKAGYSQQTSISRCSEMEERSVQESYCKELSEQERENFKNWANKQTMSSVCQISGSMRYSADFKMNLSQKKAVEEIRLVGTDYNNNSNGTGMGFNLNQANRGIMSKSLKKRKPKRENVTRQSHDDRNAFDNGYSEYMLGGVDEDEGDLPNVMNNREEGRGRVVVQGGCGISLLTDSLMQQHNKKSLLEDSKVHISEIPNLLEAPGPGGLASFSDGSPEPGKFGNNEYVTFHENTEHSRFENQIASHDLPYEVASRRIGVVSPQKKIGGGARKANHGFDGTKLIFEDLLPMPNEGPDNQMRIIQYGEKPLLKVEEAGKIKKPSISTWEMTTPKSKILKPLTLKLYHGNNKKITKGTEGFNHSSPPPFNLLETYSDPGDDSTYRERLNSKREDLASPSYQLMDTGTKENSGLSISPKSIIKSCGKKIIIKGDSNRKKKRIATSNYTRDLDRIKKVSATRRETTTTWRRLGGKGVSLDQRNEIRALTGNLMAQDAAMFFRDIEPSDSNNCYNLALGELNESSIRRPKSKYHRGRYKHTHNSPMNS